MAEEKKIVVVRNRNVGSTGYTLEGGFHREFQYNETKKIPLDELQELSYAPGGEAILRECLVIEDQNALDYLNIQVEPEYFYSEKDIKKILTDVSSESLDRLEDTLNFAPEGVIEIIKKLAVEMEIPDVRKRNLITEKTGLNINNAIMVNQIMSEDQPKEEESKTVRKTKPLEAKPNPERKAAAPAAGKYKIVTKG